MEEAGCGGAGVEGKGFEAGGDGAAGDDDRLMAGGLEFGDGSGERGKLGIIELDGALAGEDSGSELDDDAFCAGFLRGHVTGLGRGLFNWVEKSKADKWFASCKI